VKPTPQFELVPTPRKHGSIHPLSPPPIRLHGVLLCKLRTGTTFILYNITGILKLDECHISLMTRVLQSSPDSRVISRA
jgi:hypothetical protein